MLLCLSCGEKKHQDSLTVLIPDDILSLQPNKQFEVTTDSVLFNVYEPLVGFDKDLNLQPVLAESWENPRPEQWRFHIRKNVYFHDGSLLTAKTVRESLISVKASTDQDTSNFLNSLEDISIIDPYTISITTAKPFAILSKLPFIYITKQNSKGDFPPLAGTGPYVITKWNKGKNVQLEAWKRYWGSKPTFIHITFEPVSNSARRVERLKSGTADIIYGVPPLPSMDQSKSVQFARRPGLTVYYVGFNLREKPDNPYRDIRVRQAMNLAINRKRIVDGVLLGNGAIASQPVAPFVFGYDPELQIAKQNLEQAKQLMKEAGYEHGFKAKLDYNNSRHQIAEMIQQDLEAINIDLTLNGLSQSSIYNMAEAGQTDLFLIGWECGSGDASEFFEFCLHTPGQHYGLGNYGNYSNPEIDQISEGNSKIVDERQRKALLQRAAQIAMEELPVLPLVVEDDIYGMRSHIQFEPRADSEIKLIDVNYVQK